MVFKQKMNNYVKEICPSSLLELLYMKTPVSKQSFRAAKCICLLLSSFYEYPSFKDYTFSSWLEIHHFLSFIHKNSNFATGMAFSINNTFHTWNNTEFNIQKYSHRNRQWTPIKVLSTILPAKSHYNEYRNKHRAMEQILEIKQWKDDIIIFRNLLWTLQGSNTKSIFIKHKVQISEYDWKKWNSIESLEKRNLDYAWEET